MISSVNSSASNKASVDELARALDAEKRNAPPPDGMQKKLTPQGGAANANFAVESLEKALQQEKIDEAATGMNRKSQGDNVPIEGRVVGYDKNFNPITEEGLKASIKPNELVDQKVDNAEASSELNFIIESLTGKKRLNEEVLSYLDKKYADAPRPPDGMDVYVNPQNYTAEQKLARFIDLVKVKSQFEAYREARLKPHTGMSTTIKTEPEINKDIDQAMTTLLEDPAMAGLLSSEYLFVIKEVLAGKHLQDDPGKYGQDYTDAVNQMRSELETRFESSFVKGELFEGGLKRGANEKTILANYNTGLRAYASVFAPEFIESRQDTIGKLYQDFYRQRVEPKLPDVSDNMDRLLYAGLRGADVPEEQKDKIGIVTPTVDGKTYVDLGLTLKTSDLVGRLSGVKVDTRTLAEMKSLGLSPSLMSDGFAASFLPAVQNMADQLFGGSPSKKAERAEFISTALREFRPLAEKLDQGMSIMDLNGALERVQMRARVGGGPMSKYATEISTAVNGLVRGANLTGNHLIQGMFRAGSGFDITEVQTLAALAVGYEGKGLAASNQPEGALRPDAAADNSGVARKVFGTENRQWDIGVLRRFGNDGVVYASKKFAHDIRTILPSSTVQTAIIDITAQGRQAVEDSIKTYAEAVAKGIYGNDTEAVKKFAANLIRFTYNLWTGAKPGGGVERLYQHAVQLASTERGYFSTGEVTIDDQKKFMAKWGSAFVGGIRAIEAGVVNAGSLNPASISAIALFSSTATAQLLDVVSFSIKPSIDAKILLSIGEYGEAAKQMTRVSAGKIGGAMSGITDIAWLPVDIYSFVRGLKAGSFDTVEKIFQGVMIATDVGVAVDGAISLARTVIPASILQTSRLASLFIGAGGAIMSAVGAVFTLANIAVLVFLNFWQQHKMNKQFEKAGDSLDHNLSRLVNDNASNHEQRYPEAGDPWGGDAEKARLWQRHLDNMYKDDVTPFDWGWVRWNNKQRLEQANQG